MSCHLLSQQALSFPGVHSCAAAVLSNLGNWLESWRRVNALPWQRLSHWLAMDVCLWEQPPTNYASVSEDIQAPAMGCHLVSSQLLVLSKLAPVAVCGLVLWAEATSFMSMCMRASTRRLICVRACSHSTAQLKKIIRSCNLIINHICQLITSVSTKRCLNITQVIKNPSWCLFYLLCLFRKLV